MFHRQHAKYVIRRAYVCSIMHGYSLSCENYEKCIQFDDIRTARNGSPSRNDGVTQCRIKIFHLLSVLMPIYFTHPMINEELIHLSRQIFGRSRKLYIKQPSILVNLIKLCRCFTWDISFALLFSLCFADLWENRSGYHFNGLL